MNKYLSTLAISFSLLSISCSKDDINTTSELDDTINSTSQNTLTIDNSSSCYTISPISTRSTDLMDIKITNRSDYGIEVIGYVYDEDDDTIDLRYPTSKKTTGIFWNSRKRKRSFNRAIPIMIIRHKDGVEEMFQLPIRGRLQCASDGTYNLSLIHI